MALAYDATMKLIENVEVGNNHIRTDGECVDNANEILEALVDKMSLSFVLQSLAVLCNDKADHIRSNWQDEGLAKEWERESSKILKLSNQFRTV